MWSSWLTRTSALNKRNRKRLLNVTIAGSNLYAPCKMHSNSLRQHYYHPHFTEEETEAQRDHRLCTPRFMQQPAHSRARVCTQHSNSSACALNISVIVLLSPLWTINIHSFPTQWVISISCSCVSDMSHLWSEKAMTSLIQLYSLGLHKLYHSDLSLTIRFALRTLWPKWQKKKKSLRKQGH